MERLLRSIPGYYKANKARLEAKTVWAYQGYATHEVAFVTVFDNTGALTYNDNDFQYRFGLSGKRRWIMGRIEWRKNLTEAMDEIRGGTRLPMIFFHRNGCEGSAKTVNETFNDDRVVSLMERECAPVMCNADENTELAKKYHVDWTPAFVITDEDGTELERWVGFLPADDFIEQALLSKGLADFHLERLIEAQGELEELIEEHPSSEHIPEAEYFLGALNFKVTGDRTKLIDVCKELTIRYPDSTWTKRCSIWGHTRQLLRPVVGYNAGGSAGSGAY